MPNYTLQKPTMTIQEVHDLYMDRSDWIRRMTQPHAPRKRPHNSHMRAAGAGSPKTN